MSSRKRYRYRLHWPVVPDQEPYLGRWESQCGQWFPIRAFTQVREEVTCHNCLRSLEVEERMADGTEAD